MIAVNDQMPTSALLMVKVGTEITNEGITGIVKHIDTQETDEFLQFVFDLDNNAQISIRKIKQIC